MKPSSEFQRKMRLRSEELRRRDEDEWSVVRQHLNEVVPPADRGLAFDDRAWELWHRFRAELPIGWTSDWPAICVAHARRFRGSPDDATGSVSNGRLEIVARRDMGVVQKSDLSALQAEMYRIAKLVLDISEVVR